MQNQLLKNEPKKITLEVAQTQKPMRIDVYLTQQVENATRNKVQEAISEHRVLVNGKPVKANYKIKSLDTIQVTFLRPPAPELAPENIPVDIIYEDDDLMVINKAPDMVVHPAFGNWTGTLANAILHHLGTEADTLDTTDLRPGIVHRLDKNTSGLIIAAKSSTALQKLARQFANRQVEKKYQAIVWGVPDPQEGIIKTNIGRSIRNRKVMTCYDYGGKDGKPAVTEYRVEKNLQYFSLVELILHTGRTHQIRVHLKHIGTPILADEIYGGTTIRKLPFSKSESFVKNLLELIPRQALHAENLTFFQPTTHEKLSFIAPLPPDMQDALDKIEKVLRV